MNIIWIRKNTCSHGKKNLLFLPSNMAAVQNLYKRSTIFSIDRSECTPLQVPVTFACKSEQTICTALYHRQRHGRWFLGSQRPRQQKGETGSKINKKVIREDPPRNEISLRWQRHWPKYGRHSFTRNGSQKQTGRARNRVVDDEWGGTLDICNCCVLKRNETNFSQSSGTRKTLPNWLIYQQILKKKLPRVGNIKQSKAKSPSVEDELWFFHRIS